MTPRILGRVSAAALLAASAAAIAAPASAGSFYLQEQSVRGIGRANSGEGADMGASSLWWNAASIARSGREVYIGAHGLIVDSDVDNTGSTLTYALPAPTPPFPAGSIFRGSAPVGGDQHIHEVVQSGVVPNFAVALPVGDRFTVGLAAQAPYNFTTEYDADDFARYDAIKSKLLSVNLSAVVAMQVTEWLDVGVGFDAQYADAELTSALPNLPTVVPTGGLTARFIPSTTDGFNSLKGDGWNYGWNAGAQMHFGALDLGVSYRSEIEHELDGEVTVSGLAGALAAANFSAGGTASFNTPWFVTLSARYHVNDRLTLNAQVNQIGWSEFDAIRVDSTRDSVIEQNYDDVTTGAIGFDYKIDPTLTVRGGVGFDPTPTPDGQRTARIPDGDRFLVSGGLTKEIRPGMMLDGAVTYIGIDDSEISDDRDVYGNGLITSNLRGEATGYGVGFSAGLRWAF